MATKALTVSESVFYLCFPPLNAKKQSKASLPLTVLSFVFILALPQHLTKSLKKEYVTKWIHTLFGARDGT